MDDHKEAPSVQFSDTKPTQDFLDRQVVRPKLTRIIKKESVKYTAEVVPISNEVEISKAEPKIKMPPPPPPAFIDEITSVEEANEIDMALDEMAPVASDMTEDQRPENLTYLDAARAERQQSKK